MLPLDQGRLVADVMPDSVCEIVGLAGNCARHPRLFLDLSEEIVLVDFAVELPQHFFARVVVYRRRTVLRYLTEFIIFVWKSWWVLFKNDVFIHEDPWTRCQKVWAIFRIFRQVEKVDL